MNNEPLVSVVMCTYNGSPFIDEQVSSILKQDYKNIELIIVDDVSTDNTFDKLLAWKQTDERINIFQNEYNLGYNKNFEHAIQLAKGELIAISDQDDIRMESKVRKMVEGWKPECPLIYCGAVMFSVKPPDNPVLHAYYRQFEGTDARKILMRNTISGHALMIRRKLLEKVLPFKENVMYDWWMGIVAANNRGVQFYPEVLVMQREHSGNATLESGNQETKTRKRAIEKHKVINNCEAFINSPDINITHKKFAADLKLLMENSLSVSFYFPLFRFLLTHRKTLFNYKKRRIGIFSHLKHSYKRTIN